ncbi:HAD-IA family hydrolase [Clostridium perfringens]|uniref:HAD-IA family hydrolase n=1 Tax=Clostridium perfringens TaxID=1502 RepID=UPI001C87A530|nr:HAD-IA family hydrolase [Clostridium perfringens]
MIYCFDIDNTLYNPNHGIMNIINNRIIDYMNKKCLINKNDINFYRKRYSEKYGSTLKGLIIEKKIDAIEYLEYIHEIDSKYFPKEDKKLRSLLKKIDEPKIIITNSYKKYALQILESLNIIDIFDEIFDVIDMKLLYKNSAMSYKIVLKSMKLKAEDTVMIDDVRDFLICAKNVGMKTILVNKNIKSFDLDYSIENIYDLEKIFKKI